MNLTINNPAKLDAFSAIFQNMKLFSDNVNISLESTGLFLQAMDSGRVSVVELSIPNDWFDSYSVSSGMTIGVNSVIFHRILSTRDKSQNIQIESDDNPDTLLVRFKSSDSAVFDKTFEIPLIDIDSETMSIPTIEYQAEFSLPSVNFNNLMNQLKMFGENMDVDCSEDRIVLHSSSQDCGKMSVEIKIDDLNSFSIDEGEQLEMSFSLLYLYNISQFHKIAKEVELKFKRDYPVQLVYNLGAENATLRFFLAPKIKDEDTD
jgi:proliferating cell nuclear antigen PCNA